MADAKRGKGAGWKDVERADKLAHDHTRQFRDSFIDFMKENYATGLSPGRPRAAR